MKNVDFGHMPNLSFPIILLKFEGSSQAVPSQHILAALAKETTPAQTPTLAM